MAKKLYEESNISAIASAIRSKNGLSSTYTVPDMASAILSIKTDPVLESLNVSVNGSYTPGTGVDGFSKVVVSVPGSASVLASKTISQNGTYIALDDSCDGYDQVVVSVAGGSAILDLSRSYFNGYLLPVLPEISGYSNAWIRYNTSLARFDLAIASESWFATNSGGAPSQLLDNWLLTISNMSSVKGYTCLDGMSWAEWSDVSTFINFGTGGSRDVIWANHNIFTDNSFDTILYASGEAIPHYTPTSTFNVEALIVSANGSYSPGAGVDGFSNVVVSVSGSGGAISDDEQSLLDAMKHRIAEQSYTLSISGSTISFIGSNAFEYDVRIYSVYMDNCSTILYSAFHMCGKLRTAVFPSCINISPYAFANCYTLSIASFPMCTSIGNEAFLICSSLKTLYIPEVVYIGPSAFDRCVGLTELAFPKCNIIYSYAFEYCSGITRISIPACSVLSDYAFSGCSNLSEIYAPNVSMVRDRVFQNCYKLPYFYGPSVTYIGRYAFISCSNISYIDVPLVASIADGAFIGCSRLTSLSFSYLSKLNDNCFSGCYRLLSIYLLSTNIVSLTSTSVFRSTPILGYTNYTDGAYGSIFVPESLVDSYKTASYWSDISDRIAAFIE